MLEIVLINMPFAHVVSPSLGLTQLKAAVDLQHGSAVRTRILYLNHDFANYFGVELYQEIALAIQHRYSGLGDWMFRQLAFPDVPDNAEEYFDRYYPSRKGFIRQARDLILSKRRGLPSVVRSLIRRHEIAGADVAGFTTMLSQTVASIAFANVLKESNPHTLVAFGGANCEKEMGRELVEKVEVIDYVFSGPGLVSFPAFAGALLRGDRAACHAIDGVFSRRNHTLMPDIVQLERSTNVASVGQELDINSDLPLDYGGFLASFERSFADTQLRPALPFETSRGCWWGELCQCTFCGLDTADYRFMRPDLALRNIRSLFDQGRPYRRINFEAVDNVIPRSYFKEVLGQLETPENAQIWYAVRAGLTEEEVRTLAKARVCVQIGIEALESSTLKLMKKGTTSFANVELLKRCAAHGVEASWNLLIGSPGEKSDVYRRYCEVLPSLAHLQPPVSVYPVRFDRHSAYYRNPEAYGLKLHPYDCYGMSYPFPYASIQKIAYYFADENLDAEYYGAMSEWIGALMRIVVDWKQKWNERQARPRLEYRRSGDRTFVFDSRFGAPAEFEPSPLEFSILQQLKTATPADALPRHLQGGDQIGPCLERLQSRRLLFEENGRMLSLVLRDDLLPAQASSN